MNPNNYIAPNTKEWLDERIGCFTASKCVKLFSAGTRKMTPTELKAREKGDTKRTVKTLFGDGAITYINEKVAEWVNRQSKDTHTTATMQRGLDLEIDAVEMFNRITGLNAVQTGLYKLDKFIGGTPDFVIGKRKILYVGEIKSLNPENHSELSEIETVTQLREYDESFYAQLQMNIMITGAKGGFFVSFDPRPMGIKDNGEVDEELYDPDRFIYCIKIIKVKRDEAFIKELKMRLDIASGMVIKKIKKRIKAAEKNLAMYNRTQQRKAA